MTTTCTNTTSTDTTSTANASKNKIDTTKVSTTKEINTIRFIKLNRNTRQPFIPLTCNSTPEPSQITYKLDSE